EAGAPGRREGVDGPGSGGEGLPRRRVIASGGGHIAAPDGGGGVARHGGGGEVALGLVETTDRGAGGPAQAAQLGLAGHVRGLGDDGVEDADGLVAQTRTDEE